MDTASPWKIRSDRTRSSRRRGSRRTRPTARDVVAVVHHMKAQKLVWSAEGGWVSSQPAVDLPQIVFEFAAREHLEAGVCHAELQARFPHAQIVGCSTGGQIANGDVNDDAVALALRFDHAQLQIATTHISKPSQSFSVGQKLGSELKADDLRSVLVLSDGLLVNGSALVEGLSSVLSNDVIITGGLAGDGAQFARTLVVANSHASPGQVVAVGLRGTALLVGHGSAGGWDNFGPRRVITESDGNVLKGLDSMPALQLYKSYLGPEAEGLPGTALLYPLMICDPARPDHTVVRTVLSVDHERSTMTFAGNIPQGWTAQLMRGHFDNLAQGAAEAARSAAITQAAPDTDVVGIFISCIGRRLLMGESVGDEIEAAEAACGPGTKCVGFYSYGEISPHAASGACELHNQTMTVTTFAESR